MTHDEVEPVDTIPAGYREPGDSAFANELHDIAGRIMELVTRLHQAKVHDLEPDEFAQLEILGEELKLIGLRIANARMYPARTSHRV